MRPRAARGPHREHRIVLARRRGACEDAVGIDAGEPFVDQVFVRVAASEDSGIVRTRVALERLHEHSADDRHPGRGCSRRTIEGPIEQPACEDVPDRGQVFRLLRLPDGGEPFEMSRNGRLGLSPGVRFEPCGGHLNLANQPTARRIDGGYFALTRPGAQLCDAFFLFWVSS